MSGMAELVALASIVVGQLSPSDARQAGELTRRFAALADQAVALAGGGALLGLGVGILVAGVGVYLYKRRQIRARLHS
ncbi:hypothetical protein KM295_02360 [Natronomonas sp. F2-12]|jgi:hypothetical protein|uniref:Uncharacterized protein n=1 Tax=Natronomonas aquatica TaxID=2841590 RepID=A0A9R1CP54_9EURY|nr:hypothetical protein [Natronomonas aquatica]MCQ4332348.1 hypothetical protein [Natronomonas aquatica]